MPSWNIHIAHVERLLAEHAAADLGIADENIFLFGNFVPDVYLGYMVPGVTYRLDYCITHVAELSPIPVPNADWFWDSYLSVRKPSSEAGFSLALGAWAHLMADRYYNGSFRTFWQTHEFPFGDELRQRKQADFDLFGRSLRISSHVEPTPALMEATWDFWAYRLLPDDVHRAIAVADGIVESNAAFSADGGYRLLSAEWMSDVFEACQERLAVWLLAWQRLRARGASTLAADIRIEAGLQPPMPDDSGWMQAHPS